VFGRGWRCRRGVGPAPRRVEQFVIPCILLLLRGKPAHGYALSVGMVERGFAAEPVDLSLIYRALRQMEIEGLVRSWWETGLGPARRVYAITPLGEERLATWVQDLRATHDLLERFLQTYEQGTQVGYR
jgi:PadR family transcriptional regulator PadR